jgi:hypothetical protein
MENLNVAPLAPELERGTPSMSNTSQQKYEAK